MKDKENTKRKLVLAVGKIIKEEGFTNLKISRIAKIAEVDRKLIYRYFGSLDYLVEAYILENDYWMVFRDQMKEMLLNKEFAGSEDMIIEILQNQFKFFSSQKDMQRLILWELSVKSPLMRSIHNTRESMGQEFLELADPHFADGKVNFRAIAALLVGGIYYTILHTLNNGGNFAGIDLNTESGKENILKAIGQIVGWAYKEA
ncbi:TetR/AcrR family transcriptional regulator [Mucilaginibacter sp. BT774]|uniref:TetR/AcrR family transcriptional regulator n=1 Tax=Mucilaginibacter sp. BT774 TaxID=3062276 RepID=UPI00267689C1|nr:TetR/AcrR family transcriptional regulator [Mucilaginibacter sp. BT774]MDO3627531.1 TetR/AcrR family transcriptional regulator [Mucilaginibacter sp. BT774]